MIVSEKVMGIIKPPRTVSELNIRGKEKEITVITIYFSIKIVFVNILEIMEITKSPKITFLLNLTKSVHIHIYFTHVHFKYTFSKANNGYTYLYLQSNC